MQDWRGHRRFARNTPQQKLKVIIGTPSEFIARKAMSMFKATNMIKYGTVRSFLSN